MLWSIVKKLIFATSAFKIVPENTLDFMALVNNIANVPKILFRSFNTVKLTRDGLCLFAKV